ncbi:hypothetical protein GCM10007385_20330 [Tateyamaria omphalii]|uniref:hypothetical protein n=1 Tax=Tateyamaria omphalii TaxID=299262 RepID=UPI001997F54B|nr:hypothetical protein [Tateyamaria omphalii]GGX51632.1 hypothetical protein GCM10007385_20330 [Tateyamaria omphalii]
MGLFRTACIAALLAGVAIVGVAHAQTTPQTGSEAEALPDADALPSAPLEPPMTVMRMAEIIRAIDPDAQPAGNAIQFSIDDIPVVVIADPVADRMRAMVPIRSAEGLSADELMRLMQANFDSALDARYAVAQGRLWGVFIHPLSPLEKDQLLSAFVQTINVARTYGQTYSGGATVFGGGDSNGIYQELLKELQELGEEI